VWRYTAAFLCRLAGRTAAVAAAGAVLVSAHDRSGFEGFAHQRSTGQPGSPRSARRAILQSIPETYLTIDLAAEISAEICGELGRISSVADLADVAPDDMVAASRTVTGTPSAALRPMGPVAYSSTPFAPVVDGDVLPSAPWAALADGAARDVELLIGHSRDEYSLLAAQLPDIDEAHVDVLIDGLSPTPGAHRYRAAHWASTITDGGNVEEPT